jgi:hypothetical protein
MTKYPPGERQTPPSGAGVAGGRQPEGGVQGAFPLTSTVMIHGGCDRDDGLGELAADVDAVVSGFGPGDGVVLVEHVGLELKIPGP